jgi:hypothetical protein
MKGIMISALAKVYMKRAGEKRNAYWFWCEKLKGKDRMEKQTQKG